MAAPGDAETGTLDAFDATGAFVSQIASGAAYGFGVNANSVARNDTTGDVYLGDSGAGKVAVFDNTGAFVTQWNGSTTASGSFGRTVSVAVDNSTGGSSGDVYVLDVTHNVIDKLSLGTSAGSQPTPVAFSDSASYISGSQLTGTPSGAFKFNSSGDRDALAVDSSGNLYVVDPGNKVVDEFSSSGTFVQSFTGAGTPTGSFGSVVAVGVNDMTGDVYVVDAGNHVVDEFASSGSYIIQLTGTPGGAFQFPEGVAVDNSTGSSAGDVYVSDALVGVVDKFGPLVTVPDVSTGQSSSVTTTGATLSGTVNPDGTTLLSPPQGCYFEYVDDANYEPSATNPYAGGGTTACSSTPSGTSPTAVSASATGLTPGRLYDYRLVAANSSGSNAGANETFATGAAIDSESVSGVGASYATLNAQINPEGQDTTYHFEYGPTTAYGTSVPVPDSDIGSGTSDVPVSQAITGLAAGTTYHYRVVATNATGTVDGPDQTLSTYQPPAAQMCPNAQYRTGASVGLPDCRAYEQVTPVNKGGADAGGLSNGSSIGDPPGSGINVSTDGGAVDYFLQDALAGAPASDDEYLAQRTADGWQSTSMTPPQLGYTPVGLNPYNGYFEAASPDSRTLVVDDPAPLTPDAPLAYVDNEYLAGAGGSATWISQGNTPFTGTPEYAYLDGADPNLDTIVFNTTESLLPAAQGQTGINQSYLYDRTGGHTYLVDVDNSGRVLPNAAVLGAIANPGLDTSGSTLNAVSSDGSKIFFSTLASGSSVTQLWMRENNQTTTLISQPAAGVSSTPQSATFLGASVDGSKVFFTTAQQLTANAVNGSSNLYEYDTDTGQLTLITANGASDPGLEGVTAISGDGSHMYFVATAQLVANRGTAGEPNLYVYDTATGTPSFIATLSGNDSDTGSSAAAGAWVVPGTGQASSQMAMEAGAQTTPDGRYLLFLSHANLTAFDAAGFQEAYLYSAATGSIQCVSCDPSNAEPTSGAELIRPGILATLTSTLSVGTQLNISSDGSRVVFETAEPLVPSDVNGAEDVYEWERDGTGSCMTSGGCVFLLSDGQSSTGSYYAGMDENGQDIFLYTRSALSPTDTDGGLMDIYDARVDGGFASPTAPSVCSSSASCQGTAAGVAMAPAVGTVTFAGPGNQSVGTSTSKPGTSSVKVTAKTIRDKAFTLTVKVPGKGRITITGADVGKVAKSAPRAGRYALTVRLTAKAKRLLRSRHRLRVVVRVGYKPAGRPASTASVSMTVKA